MSIAAPTYSESNPNEFNRFDIASEPENKSDWIARFTKEASNIKPFSGNTSRAEAVGGRVLDTANRNLEADIEAQQAWLQDAVADTLNRANESGPTLERKINEEQAEQIRSASDARKIGVAIEWLRDDMQAGTISLS